MGWLLIREVLTASFLEAGFFGVPCLSVSHLD